VVFTPTPPRKITPAVYACHLKVALKENCHKLHLNALYLSLSFEECKTTLPSFLEPEPKFVAKAKPICSLPSAKLLGQSNANPNPLKQCAHVATVRISFPWKSEKKDPTRGQFITKLSAHPPALWAITRGYQTISQLRLMMINWLWQLIRGLSFAIASA